VLLVTAGYQPDKETHATRADVTDEVSGQGYAAGGVDANVLVNMKDDTLVLNLGGVTLPAASISARYAVYCVDRGGDAEEDDSDRLH
jgi:hypothetical protein